jgi:hypothetical protein
MSEQDLYTEVDRHRYGASFWTLTLGIIPVILDLMLGMAMGFNSRDVAEGGTTDSTADVALVVAWPLLSALAVFLAQRLGAFRTVGVTAKQVYWSGFGLVIAGSIAWSPFVALLVWAVFPGSD